MMWFWIALGVVVAGVLSTIAYYALKVWDQDRPSSQVEAMKPPFPRHLDRDPPARSDRRARTRRAGRRAR
jgi:hypothetical protein